MAVVHIDFEKGSQQLGDYQSYEKFLKQFWESALSQAIYTIKEEMQKKNWQEVRRASHSLKGACGYVSAPILAKLTETMQKESEKDPIDMKSIMHAYYSLFDYLKVFNQFVEKKLQQSFQQTNEALKEREIEGLSPDMDLADAMPAEPCAPSITNSLPHQRLAVIPEESKSIEKDRISKLEEDKHSQSPRGWGSINRQGTSEEMNEVTEIAMQAGVNLMSHTIHLKGPSIIRSGQNQEFPAKNDDDQIQELDAIDELLQETRCCIF